MDQSLSVADNFFARIGSGPTSALATQSIELFLLLEPLFAMDVRDVHQSIAVQHGRRSWSLTPGDAGMPTRTDARVLGAILMMLKLARNEARMHGKQVPSRIEIPARELMIRADVCKPNVRASQFHYEYLATALRRLATVQIESATVTRAQHLRTDSILRWLSEVTSVRDTSTHPATITYAIEVPNWLTTITDHDEVSFAVEDDSTPFDSAILHIALGFVFQHFHRSCYAATQPLRISEYALAIPLADIYQRTGSRQLTRNFKARLAKRLEESNIIGPFTVTAADSSLEPVCIRKTRYSKLVIVFRAEIPLRDLYDQRMLAVDTAAAVLTQEINML